MRRRKLPIFSCAMLCIACGAVCLAQGVEVTARVTMRGAIDNAAGRHDPAANLSDVVVWLSPLQPDSRAQSTGHPGPFRLVQKDKMFRPHLLVVPTHSSVEFPNEDPFFHNVFSLFNGKRFDLGLYESGTSRAVHFDREGVSYIFCNIHPEMGAVVLALSTPYYAVSNATGLVDIRDVPPGSYHLHIWNEAAKPVDSTIADRLIQVGTAPVHLGDLLIDRTANPMQNHKNKFGDDYRQDHAGPY